MNDKSAKCQKMTKTQNVWFFFNLGQLGLSQTNQEARTVELQASGTSLEYPMSQPLCPGWVQGNLSRW